MDSPQAQAAAKASRVSPSLTTAEVLRMNNAIAAIDAGYKDKHPETGQEHMRNYDLPGNVQYALSRNAQTLRAVVNAYDITHNNIVRKYLPEGKTQIPEKDENGNPTAAYVAYQEEVHAVQQHKEMVSDLIVIDYDELMQTDPKTLMPKNRIPILVVTDLYPTVVYKNDAA